MEFFIENRGGAQSVYIYIYIYILFGASRGSPWGTRIGPESDKIGPKSDKFRQKSRMLVFPKELQ